MNVFRRCINYQPVAPRAHSGESTLFAPLACHRTFSAMNADPTGSSPRPSSAPSSACGSHEQCSTIPFSEVRELDTTFHNPIGNTVCFTGVKARNETSSFVEKI